MVSVIGNCQRQREVLGEDRVCTLVRHSALLSTNPEGRHAALHLIGGQNRPCRPAQCMERWHDQRLAITEAAEPVGTLGCGIGQRTQEL
jgi:hypothetical protein